MFRSVSSTIRCEMGCKVSRWKLCKIKKNEMHFGASQLEYRNPIHDIKEKLERFNVPHTDGYTCYVVNDCTLCSSSLGGTSSVTSKGAKLYINKKTGAFLCNRCKLTGNWNNLSALLQSRGRSGRPQLPQSAKGGCSSYDMTSAWQNILNQCKPLCSLQNKDYDRVFKDFQLTNCSRQLIDKLDIQVNKNGNVLYIPIFYSGSVVGYKSLELNGDSTTFPKSDCAGYISSCKGGKQAIVVAGLQDFFALLSLNLSGDVLCLPYGATTLPQNLLPSFEVYDKLIFWLGVEWGAWSAGLQFAKKLNEKRCFMITSTDQQNSALTALSSGRNIEEIILDAKPLWHKFVTTFSSFREDVLAEIQNKKQSHGIQWTRFTALNDLLKGHRRGELTILTGPTGCGKTTFISDYSLDLAMSGVNTLWGSFEVKNTRLAQTMLQQFSGLSNLSDEKLFSTWADKFEQLPIYFVTLHGQNSIETVMDAVEHCSYIYDIAHVIIDNIQFMIDISTDAKFSDRFLIQDRIIQSFRRFATLSDCHVTLVMHPRKELEGVTLGISSIFGTAKAAQEADNILILQPKEGIDKYTSYLQICKNRFSGDLGKIPLQFDKSCLRFSNVNKTSESENETEKKKKQYET